MGVFIPLADLTIRVMMKTFCHFLARGNWFLFSLGWIMLTSSQKKPTRFVHLGQKKPFFLVLRHVYSVPDSGSRSVALSPAPWHPNFGCVLAQDPVLSPCYHILQYINRYQQLILDDCPIPLCCALGLNTEVTLGLITSRCLGKEACCASQGRRPDMREQRKSSLR